MAEKYSTAPIRVEGRLAFPSLFDKAKNRETGIETRYETTLLLPPDTNLKPILDILWEAWHLRWTKDQKKWPTGARVRKPEDVIRDCAEKSNLGGFVPGWHFISAGSQFKPTVLDRLIPRAPGATSSPELPYERKAECYAGRWAHLAINAFSYQNQSTGVTLGLEAVILGRNDENLGAGGGRGARIFDDLPEIFEESALA